MDIFSDRRLLASAVSSAVFQSMMNAYTCHLRGDDAGRDRWEKQADKLDGKFKTQHGIHYAQALES